MPRRNAIIASLLTILVMLIVLAALATDSHAPNGGPVSPLLFQSHILNATLTPQSYLPVMHRDYNDLTPTATNRPTLEGPTDTPTPRPTP